MLGPPIRNYFSRKENERRHTAVIILHSDVIARSKCGAGRRTAESWRAEAGVGGVAGVELARGSAGDRRAAQVPAAAAAGGGGDAGDCWALTRPLPEGEEIAPVVRKRIGRADVLERIETHRLVHPIEHGARVRLPRRDLEQGVLFE